MLGALIRQTLKGLIRAPLSLLITVILIAASASLLAVSLTLMMNLDRLSQRWEGGGELLVILSPGLPANDYITLQKKVGSLDQVTSVTLRTPLDAQSDMAEAFGVESLEVSEALDALPGTLEISVREPNDNAKVSQLRAQILDIDGVLELASMTDGEGLLAQLYSLRKALRAWLWVLGLWVSLSVAFVITQLVRLTLYQRQRELDIWVAVGASELLILAPLMTESALQTGLGAWVALIAVNRALTGVTGDAESALSLLDIDLIPLPEWSQLLFIVVSMVLGAVASFRVAKSALRSER